MRWKPEPRVRTNIPDLGEVKTTIEQVADTTALSIIVLSASRDPEVIFKASKLGADDFVGKPVDPKELDVRISKVLDSQRLFGEVTQLREQVRRQTDFTMLFGTSPKMTWNEKA